MNCSALPQAIWPRLLSRELAAEYCGVSPNTFIAMVTAGDMPPSFQLYGRRVAWDRREIDIAIDELKEKRRVIPEPKNDNGARNSWDD